MLIILGGLVGTLPKGSMQKLKVLKKLSYNGSIYNRGDVLEAQNNDAHGLIEKGLVKLFVGKNKMMIAGKKKGYIAK